MSGPYVKVFGSILNSSVWCADVVTRIVWLTLLLLADADGYVWGAVPGVARQAGVEPEACRRSLDILASPDPDSRTPDEEGRRIVAVDGGWRIVNARKYREMQTNGQRLASERSRRYRERKAGVTERDERDASRASRTEGEEEGKGEERNGQRTLPAPGGASSARADVIRVFDHWKATLNHPKAKLDKARKALIERRLRDYSADDLCAAIDGCALSDFHLGANDAGKRYDGLKVILRDAEQVERFMVMGQPAAPGFGLPTPEEWARERTTRELARASGGTR